MFVQFSRSSSMELFSIVLPIVIASHLDSVNHALLTRKDIKDFVKEKDLSNVRVPEEGEAIAL